eukprot:m.126616 g.126616  ORF g.126616 m.126616 type:complete len:75 (+) comp15775_c0_seq1:2573-2797(+)
MGPTTYGPSPLLQGRFHVFSAALTMITGYHLNDRRNPDAELLAQSESSLQQARTSSMQWQAALDKENVMRSAKS